MAEDRQQRKGRMGAAVTTRRGQAEAAPLGQTAARSKDVRITIDLTPDQHRELTRWTSSAAIDLDRPRLPLSKAIRAMIRVTAIDTDTSEKVLDCLRQD